ncbi:MAG: hypothetical protein HY360_15340 [Verrucomicrobia bacterium]|nr:hypothetical protein [Verrucomicrobiota bacterium]
MDALAHSHNPFWQLAPHSEILRRCGAGLEWCFAPFKRCGDHYGEESCWNFDALKGHNLQGYPQWQMTAESYRQRRAADLAQGGKSNQAMLFYVANAVEEQLARARFEEALIQPLSNFGTWPYETEYRVFSTGGAFGRKFESDLSRIAAENEISGFAYDSGGGMGTRKYRGSLGWEAGPQAWDEEGPYVLEGVAIARNMEFMHRLPMLGGRYKGACMINPGGEHPVPYLMVFRADRGMVEWPSINAYKPETVALLARYRLLMGQKPISMHASLRADKFGSIINWQSYSAEQITRLYQSLWRHEIVACLHFGILSYAERLWGVPEMFPIQRMLLDLGARGRRATPAVKLKPNDALVARYGSGLQTALAFGNASQALADAEAAVLGRHLDDQTTLLFTEYGGGGFRALVEKDATRFRLHLEPQNWLVLDTVAKIAAPGRIRYAASEERSFHDGRLVIENMGDITISGEITPRIPSGYRIEEARVSDKIIVLSENGSPSFKLTLPPRQKLEVKYRSQIVRASDEDIRRFPFVRDGQPGCVIALPAEADDNTRLAASWVQGYFTFWHRFGQELLREINIPIVESAQAPKAIPQVELRIGAPVSIGLQDGNLIFVAPDSWTLKDLVWKHLAILDAAYPYHGKFHADMKLWLDRDKFDYDKDTVEMLQSAGLLGANKMLSLEFQRSPKTALLHE